MNWQPLAALVLIFLIYAVIGFILEVIFVAATEGSVENRGFLAGPVVPIYAFGALAVLYVLKPVSENAVWVFLGGAVICTLLEGVTGWALMKIFRRRWWDYTDKPLNIGGYVCLQMSLLWGVACLMLVKVLAPTIRGVVDWLPPLALYLIAGIGLLLFLIDFVTSTAAAMHLRNHGGPLDEVTTELRKVSGAWSQRLGKDGLALSAKADQAKQRATRVKQDAQDAMAARRTELEAKKAELMAAEPPGVRRLRKAFP